MIETDFDEELDSQLRAGAQNADGDASEGDAPSNDPPRVVTIEEFEKFRRESDMRAAALESEAREARQAAEFLRQQQANQPQPEPQPEEPQDWLSEIESKGAAAFEGRFVTPAQLERIKAEIRAEQSAAKLETQLKTEYPDLFKLGSDFRNRVEELLQTPEFTPMLQFQDTKAAALQLASRMVKQEFESKGQSRSQRLAGAGANRPMVGGGATGPGSKATALTTAQRLIAADMELTNDEMLAAVNRLRENA